MQGPCSDPSRRPQATCMRWGGVEMGGECGPGHHRGHGWDEEQSLQRLEQDWAGCLPLWASRSWHEVTGLCGSGEQGPQLQQRVPWGSQGIVFPLQDSGSFSVNRWNRTYNHQGFCRLCPSVYPILITATLHTNSRLPDFYSNYILAFLSARIFLTQGSNLSLLH